MAEIDRWEFVAYDISARLVGSIWRCTKCGRIKLIAGSVAPKCECDRCAKERRNDKDG